MQEKTTSANFNTPLELPAAFDLSEQFLDAFNSLENSRKHAFISGKAGTGKTTFLKYFLSKTKKKAVALAPTGVAALNIGGMTIHSFFKLPPKVLFQEDMAHKRDVDLIKALDAIVIDEISMVRTDLLDAVDRVLRFYRGLNVPFGGCQMIMCGDLFQLPPVVKADEHEAIHRNYETPYFFSSSAFPKISFQFIELTKVYRQQDAAFIEILNKFRDGRVDSADIETINRLVDHSAEPGDGIITLTTTNNGADRINQDCLSRIKSEAYVYEAKIEGVFEEVYYPTAVELTLKVGAQVMLVRNDMHKRWVNGTIATIESLSAGMIRVRVNNTVYDVFPEKWERYEYVFDDESGAVRSNVVGSFSQYPIMLAWAVTIHKSQGKTFNHVIIDLGTGAFCHGQTYVALSRCTDMKGIKLKTQIFQQDVLFDDRIYQFLSKYREFDAQPKIRVHRIE